MRRATACLATLSMAAAFAACSPVGGTGDPAVSNTTAATSTGTAAGSDAYNLAIFTPADGITLSNNTPINKWAVLTSDIQKAVKDAAADSSETAANVTTKTSTATDLDKQSQDVEDYVVSHLADTNAMASTTLIVAPVSQTDEVTRQYGDYVRQDVTWNAEPVDGETDQQKTQRQAGERLVSALTLAHEAGTRVVILSNQLQGFTPDLYVPFTTAKAIGHIQAEQLARKLKLDATSPQNPKSIEVMIPLSSTGADGNGTVDTTFAQEAFAGIWEVLGPYFSDGRAVSPSGYLSSATTDDDWKAVTFDPSSDDAAGRELTRRLGNSQATNASQLKHIDGIIAMNDYVSSQVVTALTDLGYTGSSADINPEISISGIVGSLTGKIDLSKRAVPSPRKAPSPSPGASASSGIKLPFSSTNDVSSATAWPIVTGYGAYADTITHIVNGKQWMTALANRKDTATLLAKVVAAYAANADPSQIDGLTAADYQGTSVAAIVKDQLAVAASNLKTMLIDTGYITPADAGL